MGLLKQSYEVDVWNEFISDGCIRNVLLPEALACNLLLRGCCNENPQYGCYRCDNRDCEKYNPMTLRLPSDAPTATILIENVKLIHDFPRHVSCDSPLLMIRNDVLLDMMTEYLEAYSRKKKCSVRPLTPNRLTRALYHHNLCLFEYKGIRHNTYTFKMKDSRNEDIRVIFLKLTAAQFHMLKALASRPCRIENYNCSEVIAMNSCMGNTAQITF